MIEINLESEKESVRNHRQNLIDTLDTIIRESQRLKDKLEAAKESEDFSLESTTGGNLYGVIALPIIGAIKSETAYNSHLQFIQAIDQRKV